MEEPWHWKPLCSAQDLHSSSSVSGRYSWVQSKALLSFAIHMKNSGGTFFWPLPLFSYSDNINPPWCWGKRKGKILPSPCWSGTSTHTSFADRSEQLWWLLSSFQHVIVDFSAPHFFWLYICASLITLLCPTELGRIRSTNNAVHQHFYMKKNMPHLGQGRLVLKTFWFGLVCYLKRKHLRLYLARLVLNFFFFNLFEV